MGIDVSNGSTADRRSIDQGDLMLMIAGAGIAVIGLAWLLMWHPWSTAVHSSGSDLQSATPAQTAASTPASSTGTASAGAAEGGLDNPLRMAQLAYKAGMLDQPPQYSAWTLYRQVLAKQPGNEEAKQGLAQVAKDLLKRANVAVEQGRYDDARRTANRILSAFPKDAGAHSLLAKLPAAAPQSSAPPVVASTPSAPARSAPARIVEPKAAPKPRQESKQSSRQAPTAPAFASQAPEQPTVDQLLKADQAFHKAMHDNHLLTPANGSAEYYAGVLAKLAPKNEMTVNAQHALFNELLSRSRQAIAALDTDAAKAWIDAAAKLGVDPAAVTKARNALTDKLVAMESQRPLPASSMKLTSYAAPKYPNSALQRGIEGWVDLEFTVGQNGKTQDIKITDSSNGGFFRKASINAVKQWQFQPRVFMGRTIAQRAFTKINFSLDTKSQH